MKTFLNAQASKDWPLAIEKALPQRKLQKSKRASEDDTESVQEPETKKLKDSERLEQECLEG